jgi:hypothetical protein
MTNDNTKETDIVREQDKRKMEEATIIVIENELELHNSVPGDTGDRYDLGGDEWIDSHTGADTWYRQNEHRLPKQ